MPNPETEAEIARLETEMAGHRRWAKNHADRDEWFHVKMRADLAIKAQTAIEALKRPTPPDGVPAGRRVRVNG